MQSLSWADLLVAPLQGADLRRVLDFVTQHVPHVILVGAGSMHCQVLLRYMRKLCEHILDNETRTLTRTETGKPSHLGAAV